MSLPLIRNLPKTHVEKVWGVAPLPAQFAQETDEKIGEIWFTPPPELPELLVKYLFTSERLSVQNHPSDAQAREMGLGETGKSECWVIVDADPGATIAVGFEHEITAEQARAAALDGSIVDLLTWHEVRAGDVFYIPSGTVHAIGGGVSLIEIQQNSDITFRLFDYGRPRDLHLDQGLAVAETGPYPPDLRTRLDANVPLLVDGPHFTLACGHVTGGSSALDLHGERALLIPVSGALRLEDQPCPVGECILVEGMDGPRIEGEGTFLVAIPVASSPAG